MTKENVFVKHLLEFLLGLVKVCIFMALMTGTVVASAFLAIQGAFFIRDTYGFHGVAIAWFIMFLILMFACDVLHDKREQNKAQRIRNAVQAEIDRRALENKETNRDCPPEPSPQRPANADRLGTSLDAISIPTLV